MIRLSVLPAQQDMAMTEFIAEALPELKNTNLKKMLRKGDVKLNGSVVKKDGALAAGDVVEVYMPIELDRAPSMEICYEDENIIVLNKQPGMLVTAGKGDDAPDLMSMVINYMKDKGEYFEDSGYIPFPCHKLDVYTGGLTLFAKNGDMFEQLREAKNQRRIKHVFQAIVKGSPEGEKGEFKHFYVKDSETKYHISDRQARGSVPIYTTYKVLRSNGEYSLLQVEPVTQIYNQERAHLEAAGYPILGDNVYGVPRLNKKLGIRYQALWATEIRFATGVNNVLEYLNGTKVMTDEIGFPLVNF
ncbi:RluA family pseudouridine synthase [Christensenellaceae bacterium OttesenSCG-928-K19]|nr:RluA family pseudouridine synthase [Christensenellaceae bacterium OttesenSCG-928-K19]